MSNFQQAPSWTRGSVEHFRDQWIKQRGAKSFIFPRKEPQSQWDAVEHVKAQSFLRLLRKHVPAPGRILEYGCGAAGILIFLSTRGYQGIALDATQEALDIARQNDAAEGDQTGESVVSFVNSDALRMPFADATFDCVMSNGLLEHFAPEAVPQLLDEVVRVLRPGGLFIADIAHARFSTRQMTKPLNFSVAYVAQVVRKRDLSARALWQTMCRPMYENQFNQDDWRNALVAAGLTAVDVRSFRLIPPLALPRTIDRWYGRAIARLRPLRWAADVHDYNIPFGWLYLAVGVRS